MTDHKPTAVRLAMCTRPLHRTTLILIFDLMSWKSACQLILLWKMFTVVNFRFLRTRQVLVFRVRTQKPVMRNDKDW